MPLPQANLPPRIGEEDDNEEEEIRPPPVRKIVTNKLNFSNFYFKNLTICLEKIRKLNGSNLFHDLNQI